MPADHVSAVQNWAEFVHAIGWPAVAIVGLVGLRQPLGILIEKLAGRIAAAGKVSIGRDGLTLEGQIAENATRIETLEITQNVAQMRSASTGPRAARAVVSAGLAPHGGGADAAPAAATTIPQSLIDDAKTYRGVTLADDAARIGCKDQLANRMGAFVVDHAIPRDLLAQSTDEGLIVALATAIIAAPGAGDLARLLQAAPNVKRKHVAYRVVLALSQLFARRMVDPAQLPAVRGALDRFRGIADAPLLRAITRAELAMG